MDSRISRLLFTLVAVLAAGFLLVSTASAGVINTLLTGSTGTATMSLNSFIFNNDPAALPSGTLYDHSWQRV